MALKGGYQTARWLGRHNRGRLREERGSPVSRPVPLLPLQRVLRERSAGRAGRPTSVAPFTSRSRAAMIFTPPEARTEPLCWRRHARPPSAFRPVRAAATNRRRPPLSLAGKSRGTGTPETAGLPAVSVPLIPAPPGRGTSAKSAWPVRATSLRTSGRRRVSCTRQAAFACRVPSWRSRPGSLWGSQPA